VTRREATARFAATAVIACTLLGVASFGVGSAGRFAWAVWVIGSLAFTVLILTNVRLPYRLEVLTLGVLGGGLLVLTVVPPMWSEDLHRYLFDGSLTRLGIHPLAYAPSSPKVADLVAMLPGPVNHPHLPSIYPPVAQAAFATTSLPGMGRVGWRLALLGALAVTAWWTRGAPRLGALPASAALLLHPLVLVAVANEGHVDALAVPVVIAVVWGLRARRGVVVGLATVFGVGIKLFPVLWLAAMLREQRPLVARTLLSASMGLAVLSLSAVPLGPKAFGSLGTYTETWSYNGALYVGARDGIDALLALGGVAESVPRASVVDGGWRTAAAAYYSGQASEVRWQSRRSLASQVARALGGVAVVGVLVVGWARRWRAVVTLQRSTLVLFAVSPVVHPWYLLWSLGFGVSARHVPSLVWCGLAMLGYVGPALVASGHAWPSGVVVSAVQVCAVAGVGCREYWVSRGGAGASEVPGAK
jgi:alpha-1,6-mannosyltransferase